MGTGKKSENRNEKFILEKQSAEQRPMALHSAEKRILRF
jgi:hypothetical protein